MWALMYDYIIGWSDKDMSPTKTAASPTTGQTSADGLTWTFEIRTGVMWNDGVPAHRSRHRLHAQPDPRRRPRGSHLGLVSQVGRQTITAPNDTTVVLKLSEPNAVLPLLPMPILPEHIWKNVNEDDVKTYANEPTRREARRRLRAIRADRGQGRRRHLSLRGQPQLLGRRAECRRGRLPRLPIAGHTRAGAPGRRDRLRRGRHAAADRQAQERRQHHDGSRRLTELRRDRVQHRFGRHDRAATAPTARRWAIPTRPCSTPSSGSR